MADKAQLISQTRFAIEQLSERNAEHEWEHLCRHLARERVCSNILPATGPVQAGGDQGRDFETFHTFLTRSPLSRRSFVGLASEKPLAFACTIEKKETLGTKIRSDVKTIMSSGTRIDCIYVLCSRDLAVAKRHKLQEWARSTYAISLEILDGNAITELLCDRELFWLAERYLQIPAELFPSLLSLEEGDWYFRVLNKWRRESHPARTFADFAEIRAAARTALGSFSYDDKGRPINRYERSELPFWIERLDEIVNYDAVGLLRQRALYEASVLRLRGLGSLIGQEERLRFYFATIPQLEDAAELGDAEVLLTYVWTASRLRQAHLDDTEIKAWVWALQQRLDERLHEAQKLSKVNEQCALLEVRGHMALLRRVEEGVIDATGALEHWGELATLVTLAPLFPLERFADRLAQYAEYIGKHAGYEPLTQTVDTLLAKRFGHFKAAEKCLERAKAFRKAGDLSRAMAQLHRAKVDWFAEETLDKSLQAMN